MAFTATSRTKIRKRAGGKSEVTGLNTQPMHAAHIDHTKDSPNYNKPDNGLYLRLEEHIWNHIAYRGRAELTGLSEGDNEAAIMGLFASLMIWRCEVGEISAIELLAVVPDYFKKRPWLSPES